MAGTTPYSGEGEGEAEGYDTIRLLSPQVVHGIEPSTIRTVHLTDEPETSRDLPPIYFPSPTSLGRSGTIPDFEDGDLEELMTWQAQLYDGYSERQEVIEKQYAITHKLRTLHQELVDKGLGTANIARLKRQAEQLYSEHENMERSMHNLYTPEYIQGLERQIRRLQKQSERGGEEATCDEDEEPSVGTLRAEVQAALGRKAAQEKCLQAAEMVQMQANGTRNHNLTSWREQLHRARARQDRMGHLLDEEELALTLAKEQRTAVTCRLEKLREDVARLRALPPEQQGRSEQLGEGQAPPEADSYGSRSDSGSNEQDTVEHTPPPLFPNIAPSAEIDSPPSSVNDSMIVPPIPPGLMELDSEGSQAPDMMSSSDSQSTRLGSKSTSFLTSNNRPFPGSASKLSLFSYSRSGESLDGYYTGMDSMDPGSPPGSPLLWMSGSRHILGTADETTDDDSVMAAFRHKVSTSMPVAMGQANPHLAPFITSPAPPPPPGSIPPTLIAPSTPQPMVLQPPPAAHTQFPMQFVPPTVVQVV